MFSNAYDSIKKEIAPVAKPVEVKKEEPEKIEMIEIKSMNSTMFFKSLDNKSLELSNMKVVSSKPARFFRKVGINSTEKRIIVSGDSAVLALAKAEDIILSRNSAQKFNRKQKAGVKGDTDLGFEDVQALFTTDYLDSKIPQPYVSKGKLHHGVPVEGSKLIHGLEALLVKKASDTKMGLVSSESLIEAINSSMIAYDKRKERLPSTMPLMECELDLIINLGAVSTNPEKKEELRTFTKNFRMQNLCTSRLFSKWSENLQTCKNESEKFFFVRGMFTMSSVLSIKPAHVGPLTAYNVAKIREMHAKKGSKRLNEYLTTSLAVRLDMAKVFCELAGYPNFATEIPTGKRRTQGFIVIT